MSDNNEPKKKKSGFISNQDMWELSLDMVGEDDIDSMHRTGELIKKPIPEPGLEPELPTESRAKVVSARQRQGGQDKTGQVNKPGATSNSAFSNTGPVTPQKRTTNSPENHGARQVIAPTPRQPPENPAGLSSIQKQAAGSRATGARKMVKEPPVVSFGQPAPKQEKSARPELASKQKSAPEARPRQAPSSPGQQSAKRKQSVPDTAPSMRQPESRTRQDQKNKSARRQPGREVTAVFAARDVNLDYHPQDADDVDKKVRREKFLRLAGFVWGIFDFLWGSLTSLFSRVVKILPFLYRQKIIIAASVISFVVGVYVGGLDDSVMKSLFTGKTTSKPVQTDKLAAVKKIPKSSKKKPVRRATESSIRKPARIQETTAQETIAQETTVQELPVAGSDLTGRQFSGKDIVFEDSDSQDSAGAEAVTDSEQLEGGQQAGSVDISEAVSGILNDEGVGKFASDVATSESAHPGLATLSGTENDAVTTGETVAAELTGSPDLSNEQRAEIQALFNKNVRMFDKGDWLEVVGLSNQILELDPMHIPAHINRSIAYTELGSFDLAIDDANTVIAMDKNNAVSYNNRGYAYERAGQVDQAISDYEFACRLGVEMSCQEVKRLRRTGPAGVTE